jgi:hypothetical protein
MSGATADERVQSLTAEVRGLREDVSRIMDHFGISRAPTNPTGNMKILSQRRGSTGSDLNEVMIRFSSMKFMEHVARLVAILL